MALDAATKVLCDELLTFDGEKLCERVRSDGLGECGAENNGDDEEEPLRVRRVGVEYVVNEVFLDGGQSEAGDNLDHGECGATGDEPEARAHEYPYVRPEVLDAGFAFGGRELQHAFHYFHRHARSARPSLGHHPYRPFRACRPLS